MEERIDQFEEIKNFDYNRSTMKRMIIRIKFVEKHLNDGNIIVSLSFHCAKEGKGNNIIVLRPILIIFG